MNQVKLNVMMKGLNDHYVHTLAATVTKEGSGDQISSKEKCVFVCSINLRMGLKFMCAYNLKNKDKNIVTCRGDF
jgi:hypothetical protein